MQKWKFIASIALISVHCKVPPWSKNKAESAAPGYLAVNTSTDGLILRSKPDKTSEKLGIIAFAQTVEVSPEKDPVLETIGSTRGEWLRAYYYGQNGFVFSGYLRRYSDLRDRTEEIDAGQLPGVWISQKYTDYTKTPVTKLTLNANREFSFMIFAGGDSGDYGTKSLTGKWQAQDKLLVLTETKTGQNLRYALHKKHLILAEDAPHEQHRVFLENFESEYPGGLSKEP